MAKKNKFGQILALIVFTGLLTFAFCKLAPDKPNLLGTGEKPHSSQNNDQSADSTQTASTGFVAPIEDQISAIGISEENSEYAANIFQNLGIKDITGAKKESESFGRTTYVLESESNIVLTIMVKNNALFYVGVNSHDAFTASKGVENRITHFAEEHDISDADRNNVTLCALNAIKATVKYPDTVSLYSREANIERYGNEFRVYAAARYKNALGSEETEYYYITVIDDGSSLKATKLDSWNSLINEATSNFGDTYGTFIVKKAQNNAYENKQGLILLRREIELFKIFQKKDEKPEIASLMAASNALMCGNIASDIGFDPEDIFRRICDFYKNDNPDGLLVLGIDLDETY